jgi:hypothetical protein
MEKDIVYILYGIVILQFVGILLSFFVRSWFERVQRDIDELERRCEERGLRCPVDKVSTRLESLEEDVKENRKDITRLYEKVIG